MNHAALWVAVRARALADNGTGGLFNAGTPLATGIFYNSVPEAQAFPFITFDVASEREAGGFSHDARWLHLYIGVYVERQPSAGGDPALRGSQILERLEGNWVAQGGAPTYGFNRHALTLSGTNWTTDAMLLLGTRESHEEGVYHWIQEYRLLARLTA